MEEELDDLMGILGVACQEKQQLPSKGQLRTGCRKVSSS